MTTLEFICLFIAVLVVTTLVTSHLRKSPPKKIDFPKPRTTCIRHITTIREPPETTHLKIYSSDPKNRFDA